MFLDKTCYFSPRGELRRCVRARTLAMCGRTCACEKSSKTCVRCACVRASLRWSHTTHVRPHLTTLETSNFDPNSCLTRRSHPLYTSLAHLLDYNVWDKYIMVWHLEALHVHDLSHPVYNGWDRYLKDFYKGAGAKCDHQRIGVCARVRANLDLDVRGACVRRKKPSQPTPWTMIAV